MEAIRTIGLTKRYKDTVAVNKLDLEIEEGELFALLGVNGAGKSTTVNMLSCLTKVSEGDAFIKGYSILKDENEIKKIIGVAPQETAVAPNLSVKENLEPMCGLYGFSEGERKSRVEELASSFGLDQYISKKAGKLSGGWQRRLSIAMALVSSPQILFLDEPTLGLDVIIRSDMWDMIKELKGNTTIVLTTHYMEEVEALADRVGIMKDGCLLAIGTVSEIKEKAGKDRFEDAFVAIVKGSGEKKGEV